MTTPTSPPEGKTADEFRSSWLAPAGAAVLALALMGPVWLPDLPPPTGDGAIHVFMAAVVAFYDAPAFEAFRAYFTTEWRPVPNLTIFVFLRWLLELASPQVAEKILISGYLLGLPLATWFCARALGAQAWIAVLLILPIGYGMLFHFGFYNYCYGQIAALIAIAAYFRAEARARLRDWLWLGLAALLGYATHIFAAMAIVTIVGLSGLWRWITLRRGADGEAISWVAGFRRHALPPALALLPTAVAILAFVAYSQQTPASPFHDGSGLAYRLYLLLSQSYVVAYGKIDLPFASGLLIAIVLMVYRYLRLGRREEQGDHRLLFAFAVLVALFFAVPLDFGGGGMLMHRLQPYIHITLALWLASRAMSASFQRTMTAALFVLALALPIHRNVQYRKIDAYRLSLDTLFDEMAANSTLYTLFVGPLESPPGEPDPSWRANPLLHHAGYAGAARGIVFLNAYQAHSRNFPVHYRPEMDLHNYMTAMPDDGVAHVLAVPALERFNDPVAGRRMDYILLAGRAERAPSPLLGPFMAALKRDYRIVAEVERPGPFRLYGPK